MADTVTPLCSLAQFNEGAYSDLASGYSTTPLNDILIEATRLCEESCNRRLAPFTLIETTRATGIDPDEYAESGQIPMDIQGTLGMSYASATGSVSLVRHCWLNEYPARNPELWAYSGVSVSIIRSYGGSQLAGPGQILEGPDDTGHLWFSLGTFLPPGSRIQTTYSGGYTVAVPASLVRACKLMAAYIIVRELDPESTAHDPDLLREDATTILAQWQR